MTPSPTWEGEVEPYADEWSVGAEDEEPYQYGYGLSPTSLPMLLGMRGAEGAAYYDGNGGPLAAHTVDGYEAGSVKGYNYPSANTEGGYAPLKGGRTGNTGSVVTDADSKRVAVQNLRKQAY
jgi:hypothetical protein